MITPLPANSISLKKIADLKDEAFFVPQYQRGYRWTPQQVTELLNDLNSFHAKDENSFYCLQPVLVKECDGKWELIDGQQRLTTIYLLLDYLEGTKEADYKPLFTLEYATRPDSGEYLQNLTTTDQATKNIDYYYLNQSLTCIKDWFTKQPVRRSALSKLSLVLLEQTKVIWYELDPNTGGEQDAFIRINSGKIPLTNAELIRALFLKQTQRGTAQEQRQFETRQREMATQWDAIEARLQQDDLWYFLNRHPNAQPTRIEYLFDLLVSAQTGKDVLATFHYFNNELSKATPDELLRQWQKVKELFLRLEQWYDDRDLYHWVGYLITVGVPVRELVAQASDLTKKDFKKHVQQRIREKVQGPLEEWEYGSDSEQLQNVLLLFNIETLRKNDSYRFPFRQYKGGGKGGRVWSIEHINAQNPQGLGSKAAYRDWLAEAKEFVEAQAQQDDQPRENEREAESENPKQVEQDLYALLRQPDINKDEFGDMQQRIFGLFGRPDLDTIDNLALLDGRDNSALGNGTFPQKRKKIIALETYGSFIPIATRNVFLKYYSTATSDLTYWGETDRRAYVAAIRSTLYNYLTPITDSTDGN